MADLEVGDLRGDAERMPGLQVPERLAVGQRDRRRMAGRRPRQRHVRLDHHAQHRDELRRGAVLVHELRVDRPQDRRRIVEVGRAGGHHRAHERRAPRRRQPLADDVADHQHDGAVARLGHLVEVARDAGLGGDVAARQLEQRQRRRLARREHVLERPDPLQLGVRPPRALGERRDERGGQPQQRELGGGDEQVAVVRQRRVNRDDEAGERRDDERPAGARTTARRRARARARTAADPASPAAGARRTRAAPPRRRRCADLAVPREARR